MRFEGLAIDGAYAVHLEELRDERGFFARTVSSDMFAARGLVEHFSQSSISFNLRAGTLRGMHYSVGPNAETKLVRCTAGATLDVIVDIRAHSPTRGKTVEIRLDPRSRVALYIPKGVAHGFQTLQDGSEILYMIDKPYDASASRGLRWNDSFFTANWPLPVSIMSQRDAEYPDFAVGPA